MKRSGFTLIELLVVMALIAIIAAAGGIMSSGYLTRRRVEQYAGAIVQDLRTTQADTMFSRAEDGVLGVTFFAASGQYVVTSRGGTTTRKLLGGVRLKTVQFGTATPKPATDEGTWTVSFDAYGSPRVTDSTHAVRLGVLKMTLQGSSGPQATVELSPVLGRATISWPAS